MEIQPKKTILLHTCCGPCATGCLGVLLNDGRPVTLFFSNSNLSSEEEYEKRLEAARTVAEHYAVSLFADRYDHAAWREAVARGYENEPERGIRCARCFRFSLSRTAAAAKKFAKVSFSTTLTVSPHKDSAVIFREGAAAGPGFEAIDFKKDGGFLRSVEIAKRLGLYRQTFCGCEFSGKAARKNPADGKNVRLRREG